MPRTTVTRTIHAPADVVFSTVADISQFSQAVPHIVKVEFLSDVRSGLGTRFRETRLMKGRGRRREARGDGVRAEPSDAPVANSHGTVWDTLFEVRAESGFSILTVTMDATARGLLPKIMNLLIGGMVRRAIERDMESVKIYCERTATAWAPGDRPAPPPAR